MQKSCTVCKEVYIKQTVVCSNQWAKSRYCSVKCKGKDSQGIKAHNNGQVEKNCQQCHKNFMVSPYRIDKAKYCSRACIGRSRSGDKSPHWQGGKTVLSQAIRNSEKYKLWRSSVFERDEFTCRNCNQRGGKLEVDHVKLFSRYPELRFEISNGQTLCKDCHRTKTTNDLKLFWVNQFSSNTIEALN